MKGRNRSQFSHLKMKTEFLFVQIMPYPAGPHTGLNLGTRIRWEASHELFPGCCRCSCGFMAALFFLRSGQLPLGHPDRVDWGQWWPTASKFTCSSHTANVSFSVPEIPEKRFHLLSLGQFNTVREQGRRINLAPSDAHLWAAGRGGSHCELWRPPQSWLLVSRSS